MTYMHESFAPSSSKTERAAMLFALILLALFATIGGVAVYAACAGDAECDATCTLTATKCVGNCKTITKCNTCTCDKHDGVFCECE